jgi:phosphatidylethanolamine/phosphatidyl-N-methylethanolamine N-methyltransferase
MARALPIPTLLLDEGRFLWRLLKRPKGIGAVAPSSGTLARALAQQVPDTSGPVLELGPGTGVVTEAILARGLPPQALTVVEYEEEFARVVAEKFPGVRVIRGDAFDLARTLGPSSPALFSAIISGLPLLNFPQAERARFLEQVFARLAPGAPFVQFSYGMHPPVPPPTGASVVRTAFVAMNIPPARVWVYRKTEVGSQ